MSDIAATIVLCVWLGIGFALFLGCVLDGDNPLLGVFIAIAWPAFVLIGYIKHRARKIAARATTPEGAPDDN